MERTYRIVSIYVDPAGNLIILPFTTVEMRGVTRGADVEVAIPHRLANPFSDEELDTEVKKALENCFTRDRDPNSKYSAIEEVLGIKGYEKAVRDKKLVDVKWTKDQGYRVTPTRKEHKPRRGYTHLVDMSIRLDHQLAAGALGKAIREAIAASTL